MDADPAVVTALQPNTRLTPAQSNQLVADYQVGASVWKLSDIYSLSPRAVRAHIHRAGIPLRPKTMLTRDQAKQLIDRYQQGETGLQLATTFNCSQRTVFLELKRAGISPRPRGRVRR